MKKLIFLICAVTPMTTFAHTGHGLKEQVHGVFHAEHLFILLVIAAVIGLKKIIDKYR